MKRRDFIGSVCVATLLSGCGSGSSSASTTPGNTQGDGGIPTPLPSTDNGISLSALSAKTIYIAHRGSAALYPEETDLAYERSLSDGQKWLECDVQSLRDGSLGIMHDATVDRTTTASAAVNSLSSADWLGLSSDGNTWHGSNFGNNLTLPLFDEWVRKYKGRAILVPEDKDWRSMPAMLSTLASQNVSRDQVLIQSFLLDTLKPAIAAGYQTCFLTAGGADPAAVRSAGVTWVGLNTNLPDAEIKNWISYGFKVLVWTINRRLDRDYRLPLGVTGFFSDDPLYLASSAPLRTQDRFATGTWEPGMLGSTSDFELASRGEFFAGGYWGYSATAQGYVGCLQGYLCPIKGEQQPKNYQVELSVTFGEAVNNDASRWASIFMGVDDRAFIDGSEGAAGYHILCRKSGAVEIFKKEPQKRATLLIASVGKAIQTGEEVRYRISVTETSIKISRLDSSGSEIYSVTAQDAAYRTPYLQLGRNGLACRFRQLIVS